MENISKDILMTIVRNSGGRLENGQDILEINEQQIRVITKKLTELLTNKQRELLYAVCDKLEEVGKRPIPPSMKSLVVNKILTNGSIKQQ